MALTRVDDRSSSIIYSSGWGRGGAATDYNDSVTYAGTDGETATLTFQGVLFDQALKQCRSFPSNFYQESVSLFLAT